LNPQNKDAVEMLKKLRGNNWPVITKISKVINIFES
jgi:hypothetical protein